MKSSTSSASSRRMHGIFLAGCGTLALVASLQFQTPADAALISDVRNTKHNLSTSGPGSVRAQSETEICVFCHTPHGSTSGLTPLWNRTESGASYTLYDSSSLDAATLQGGSLDNPGGSSKLCLSCHDGSVGIGTVANAPGTGNLNTTIPMSGTAGDGTMPGGTFGALTGFTRDLGSDLTNDHPISVTYTTALALADGELRDPATSSHIGVESSGTSYPVPLEPTEPGTNDPQVQCATCHDPHIRDDTSANIKFLRLNRFQEAAPSGGAFSASNDIVCLACHDKLGTDWSQSAHANPTIADETYKAASADIREFPSGLPVWRAACLNCHDTHTVSGARRLLREGTDAPGGPSTPKVGGNSAIEETCYQCHTTSGNSVLTDVTQVPDIETDFTTAGNRHMPIATSDQPASSEVHDIIDADFSESQALLGKGNLNNRHAECTDCHNPHRALRNRLFNGAGATDEPTHSHTSGHSNLASGVLKGTWGVEPIYSSNSFHDLPSSYEVKKGVGTGTAVTETHVTREYQICLKCHSDYGYDDNNIYPIGNRPDLESFGGGTPSGTNGLTQYTNQAKEIQAPSTHKGEGSASNSGAGSTYTTNNHRSWHPVMDDTGRTASIRNMSSSTNLFLTPWNGTNIGSQTMYCSDCHGSNTANGTVVPTGGANGNPWGPHGSSNNFILKGTWDSTTGSNNSGLCFRCHNHTNYATDANEGNRSGFESGFGDPSKDTNLHAFHAKRIGKNLQCMWCHVAVPHGWKNKALLVNLNDVGPEAGLAPNTEIAIGSNNTVYNQQPYYRNAKNKIKNFKTSGNWVDNDCGSRTLGPETGDGLKWMKAVCSNPP